MWKSARFRVPRFNEAAGIHRRKPNKHCRLRLPLSSASMRPPEFTGGNACAKVFTVAHSLCFNEAAGIHRRKHAAHSHLPGATRVSFNEAAGIHRRKRGQRRDGIANRLIVASMRPPEFTGGNYSTVASWERRYGLLQ